MADKNIKSLSKDESWSTPTVTNSELQTSCLMRIADASELMAKNHRELVSEADRYQKWYHEERARREKLERKVIALKGVITRLKNKQKEGQEG